MLVIIGLWAVSFIYYWAWWFQPAHLVGLPAYVLITLIQAWVTFLPAYFVLIFLRACKPTGPLALPTGSRVAMIVTKAPSEPFEVVRETLLAMLAQDYPHDTWLADEQPEPETLRWCMKNGVRVSTRHGVEAYHRAEWPRRTRCKEGNLAYFYDMYGYRLYDFVVQLDADHVPQPGYLREMLKPFSDPGIGYVSAPSICNKNAAESWSARSRLYCEATMHGPLQAGYNGGWAPMCIGSHYAVRTEALRDIGGLGPELAEDHSTTLMFNAHGWRGVHAVNAIAHGDGPATFTDLVTQEFQWSRSLMMVLLNYTPQYLRRLPARLKFQFLFAEFWYPLFAVFMAICYLLPIVALASRSPLVGVTYPEFLLHSAPTGVILTVMVARLKHAGILRPVDAPLISWEGAVFMFAKWPWVLMGTAAALYNTYSGSRVEFRVTPKGKSAADPVPLRAVAPYLVLSIGSALPVLLVANAGFGSGFYIFALINALIYAAIFILVLLKHEYENPTGRAPHYFRPAFMTAMIAMTAVTVAGSMQNGLRGIDSVSYGLPYVALTERTYPIAGAGRGGHDVWSVKFNPRFLASGAVPSAPLQKQALSVDTDSSALTVVR